MSTGALPQSPWGSLQRSPGLLAGFKGVASLQEGMTGRNMGREKGGNGEGRGKEGVGGIAPWVLWG